MKNSLWILLIIVIVCVGAASTSNDTEKEIIKALNIQNQQLARIATSLEKISGQQPGWKLPK